MKLFLQTKRFAAEIQETKTKNPGNCEDSVIRNEDANNMIRLTKLNKLFSLLLISLPFFKVHKRLILLININASEFPKRFMY